MESLISYLKSKLKHFFVFAIIVIYSVLPSYAQQLPFEPPSAKAVKTPQSSTLQQDIHNGSLTYSCKIEVPPGTNDFQPNLNLSYDSHGAKGRSSWVGLGWDLNTSYIQRDVNYTPDDLSDDTFDLILNGAKFDLIYIPEEGRYHAKIETHFWIERLGTNTNELGEYWIVKDKSGAEYRFGYSPDSENRASTRNYVGRWSLDQIKDTNNNKIFFFYQENPNTNDIGAVYLSEIRYNNDQMRSIRFILEGQDKTDAYIVYEQGSKIRKTRRLKEIDVLVSGERVRKYVLDYSTSSYTNRSLLRSITQFGADGTSALPPTTFSYQEGDFGFNPAVSWTDPGKIQQGDDLNLKANTFDINRDGLPDYTNAFVGSDWGVRLNNTSAFDAQKSWDAPDYWIHRNDANNFYDTFDINGDHLADFIYANGSQDWSVYWNNGSGFNGPTVWHAPEGWVSYTVTDFSGTTDYDTFDMNADGLPDFVKKSTGNDWLVYLNTGDGFGQAQSWNAFGYEISAYEIPIQYGPDDCEDDCRHECPEACEDPCDDQCRETCHEFCEDCEEQCYEDCFNSCDEEGYSDSYCDSYCSESCAEECSDCENDCEDEHCWGGGDWTDECEDGCVQECEDQCAEQCEDVYVPANEKSVYTDTFDINGDGLPDLVYPTSGSNWDVYLNNGNGFDQSISWPAVSWVVNYSEVYEGEYYIFEAVVDINADGLVDFTIRDYQNRRWRIFFNTGSGFGPEKIWDLNTGASDAIQSGDYFNVWSKLTDLNGDGALDFVKSQSGWQVYLNKMAGVDLLREIHTSKDATIRAEYTPSTQYDNTGEDEVSDLGSVYWCLSSLTEDNGMSGAHNIVSTINYKYANGFYDYEDKEFRGFGYVKVTEPNSDTSEHYFHQDDARKGKTYRVEHKDAQGNLFRREEKTWNTQTLYTNPENVYGTYLEQEEDLTFDGQSSNPKTTKIQYEYDSYGNVKKTAYQGDIAVQGDEKYEYKEYVYNTNLWIVDKIKNSYLKDYDDVTKVKESWYAYDYGNVGDIPTKGNLTKLEAWFDTGLNPATEYMYDEYGNEIEEIDPERHSTITVYDETYHTVPVEIKNAKSQVTTFTFDEATGDILSKTDPNQYTTAYEYDTFKRLIKEIQPLDSSNYPTIEYQYFVDGIAPEGLFTKKREVSGETDVLEGFEFKDGFDRLIQTKTEAEDSTKQIVTDTFYNTQGTIDRISVNYFANKTTDYSSPDSTQRNISYQYDSLGRITRITNPDGTFKTNAYDHWTTIHTNEKGIPIEFVYDAYKRLAAIKEYSGQEVYTTNYQYNTQDLLTRITDAQSHETIMQYDSLGRKVGWQDPNMGSWRLTYDQVGNILSLTDAKTNTITFSYDELNRIRTRNFSTSDTEVEYIYDSPTMGTVSQVNKAENARHFFYDERLRKIQEDQTIDSSVYTTQWQYDAMDRITKIIYPDTSQITYEYNAQGKTERIPSYLMNVDYNPQGQIIKRDYANGLSTEFTYDDRDLRLKRIYAASLQDMTFTYDELGRVTSISDAIHSENQTFQYDDLSRLTIAEGPYGTFGYTYDSLGNIINKGNLRYFYESGKSHAVTRIEDKDGVEVMRFVYDANGNMVKMEQREAGSNPAKFMVSEYGYDGENYLTEVRRNGFRLAAYTYDGDGLRIKKTVFKLIHTPHPSAEDTKFSFESLSHPRLIPQVTRYVGELYEEEKTRKTNNIFLDATRMAAVTSLSGGNREAFYYSGDHLQSTSILTDAQGSIKEFCQYEPWGQFSKHEKYGSEDEKARFYFTDQLLDEETGLYYFGYRYYNPLLGRFLTADPREVVELTDKDIPESSWEHTINDITKLYIKEALWNAGNSSFNLHYPQDFNKYSYVQNNPLNAVDPTGLIPVTPWDVLDVGFFVQSANEFRNNPGWGTGANLALDTVSLLPVIPSLGLFTRGDNIADVFKGVGKAFKSSGAKAGEAVKGAVKQTGKGEGRLIGKQATRAANRLGFQKRISARKAPFNSHGQPVFQKGNKYITPDADQHSGGAWKMYEKKGGQYKREGTYDASLNRIGD